MTNTRTITNHQKLHNMNKVKFLVLHCTATPEGREVTTDQIEIWHRGALKNADGTYTFLGVNYTLENLKKQTLKLPGGKTVSADKTCGRGWRQLGYTDMFMLDGKVERLTPNNDDGFVDAWEVTNGVAGINSISRHLVYVGGTDKEGKAKDTRTGNQLAAMVKYVHDFVRKNPDVLVAGHNQFDKKACPSFDVPTWLRQIRISENNIYKPK